MATAVHARDCWPSARYRSLYESGNLCLRLSLGELGDAKALACAQAHASKARNILLVVSGGRVATADLPLPSTVHCSFGVAPQGLFPFVR